MTRPDTQAIITVALPVPLDKTFDYWAPPSCSAGDLVSVPFGHRHLLGVVINNLTEPEDPQRELKTIEMRVQAEAISASSLALACWMADYYHHPLGEVLLLWLPNWAREQTDNPGTLWMMNPEAPSTNHGLSPNQKLAWQWLQSLSPKRPISATWAKMQGHDERTLQALHKRGYLVDHEASDEPNAWPATNRHLSASQAQVVAKIEDHAGFGVHVIHGVTGSGKTEVYLQVMTSILRRIGDQPKQILFLVPEIGLTPQMVSRLQERLPVRMGVCHSQMPDRLRAQLWQQCREGKIDVLLGTRSAVFAPLERLALIVIDEEHDSSFKEQTGCRYHARDLAVLRAHRAGVPILLGSATPALETMANLQKPHYHHHKLCERICGQIPQCHVLDMRGRKKHQGIDERVWNAVDAALKAGEQVLLFLNRRGFAPVWFCQACGWHAICDHCDIKLTYHRERNHLRCHHCGSIYAPPTQCPDCRQEALMPVGMGTEKVESLCQERWPDTEVLRIDSDTVSNQKQWQASREAIERQHPMIILGTQMLAKGHDFKYISTVVVLGLDQGLLSHEYRASERTMQMVIQVAGRAGRHQDRSQVILPTHYPDMPIFHWLKTWDYIGFCQQEMQQRQITGLPPSTYAARIQVDHRDQHTAQAWLNAWQKASPKGPAVREYGPVPAAISKRKGLHRSEMLVVAKTRQALHDYLYACREWEASCRGATLRGGLKLSLDLSPE